MSQGIFQQTLEEIGRDIAAGQAHLEASAGVLAQAVRDARLPEEEVIAEEAKRHRAAALAWRRAETALAAEVSHLAAKVQIHKSAFDRRDQPNRLERLLGWASKRLMRRSTERRWAKLASFDRLGEMLQQADALCRVTAGQRQALQEARRGLEQDLEQFGSQRAAFLKHMGAEPGAAARAEAMARVEEAARLYEKLARVLNRSIGSCHALLHKLTVETEEMLILYRVIADVLAQQAAAEAALAPLAHLGEAPERFRKGRLIGRDLDRLRAAADDGFFRAFPGFAPVRAPAEREAERGTEPAAGLASQPVR